MAEQRRPPSSGRPGPGGRGLPDLPRNGMGPRTLLDHRRVGSGDPALDLALQARPLPPPFVEATAARELRQPADGLLAAACVAGGGAAGCDAAAGIRLRPVAAPGTAGGPDLPRGAAGRLPPTPLEQERTGIRRDVSAGIPHRHPLCRRPPRPPPREA